MPYVAAKTFRQMNATLIALEKKVEELAKVPAITRGIDITQAGVLPTNTGEENSNAIKMLLAELPEGFGGSLYAPYGKYHFSEGWEVNRRPIRLSGDNGSIFANGTQFIFPAGITGFNYDRQSQSTQEAIVERVCFIATGKSEVWASGVRSTGRIKVKNCTAKGFSHNGFDVWASMGSPEGNNDASASSFEYCHAIENEHDGFFAGITDTNCITYIGCDARDNGRHGFFDSSMLGNNYISCMAHYNCGGDFSMRDVFNARNVIVGFYSEGGNKNPSMIGIHTVVVGGTWGTGYTIGIGGDPLYGSYDEKDSIVKTALTDFNLIIHNANADVLRQIVDLTREFSNYRADTNRKILELQNRK